MSRIVFHILWMLGLTIPWHPLHPNHEGWTGWRGPNRDGHTAWLPTEWKEPTRRWVFPLPSNGVGGVAANEDFVIVTARDRSDQKDVFLCLDSTTGLPLWKKEVETIGGPLDYGNSPRATPLIADPYVITLSAFGQLTCWEIDTGEVLWSKHLINDLGGRMPIWGFTGSPLLIGNRLIVQPGGEESSLVALDLETGGILWKSSGRNAAYASPLSVRVEGRDQIVVYDESSLGGWDVETGRRLWEMKPAIDSDFNVPTPVAIEGGLVLISENNATRVHRFDGQGHLESQPSAEFPELAGDTHSPIRLGSYLIGVSDRLYVLDLGHGLKKVAELEDRAFGSYTSLIACEDRFLVLGYGGQVVLYRLVGERLKELGRFATQPGKVQLLSHPAMVDRTLYVRGPDSLTAWEFEP